MAAWKRAIATGTNWSAAEAAEALCAQAKSGGSVVSFARRHGISARRLYWWRTELAERKGERRSAERGRLIPMTVIDAPIAAPRLAPGGVVVIDGGLRVEVEEPGAVSPVWIATLLRTVREGA
ncbi:MAG: transposase [Myxococcota bacterium]|nr:transposase [Myxococcota bacterium]